MIQITWSSIYVPYLFQIHPSNFKVTWDNKSPSMTQIERFRTMTQIWIHLWLEMMRNVWRSIEEVTYCFSRSSIKFQGHTGWKIHDLNQFFLIRLLGQSQYEIPQICLVPYPVALRVNSLAFSWANIWLSKGQFPMVVKLPWRKV